MAVSSARIHALGEIRGVVGTLATPIRPLFSSTNARSVKVPPISTPMRQAMPPVPRVVCRHIVDRMVGIGQGGWAVRTASRTGAHDPHPSSPDRPFLPVAASGQGAVLRDAAGNEYIDASAGAAVSCLGHSHPDVLAAMRTQLDPLAYAHTSFFTTDAAEQLADDLSRTARRHRTRVSSSAAGRRRSRPRSSSRGNISSSAASRSGDTSSLVARATTASRSARSQSVAANGSASSSRRC